LLPHDYPSNHPQILTTLKHYLSLLLLSALPVTAATMISQTSFVSTVVPDNDDTGLVDSQEISTSDMGPIVDISVELEFSGGWNGDLYVYLVSDAGFAVLLNRPGRSSGNPDGASSSGMLITLGIGSEDGDVHTTLPSSGSDVTGTYQADGRETDPDSVLDTDSRTALLNNFLGDGANGTWTVFVADMSAGSTSTFESWTLNLTVGEAIPEPGTCLLFGLGVMSILRRRRAQAGS